MKKLAGFMLLCGAFAATDVLANSVLFKVQGSNTVGAALAPSCAKAYLEHIGVRNVRIREGSVANESVVAGVRGQGLLSESVQIHFAAHGSSTGFTALASGDAHIAMSSRAIKSDEVKALQHLGNLRSAQSEQAVAIDGLAVIVHPSNPVSALTAEQIAQLFAGKITNWQQLGGENVPVSLYARDDNSGTWDTFSSLVMGKNYNLDASAQRFESNDQLSDKVSTNRGAIGFVGLASVRDAKLLAVAEKDTAAIKPDTYSVATEDYPLSRRLFFYLPEVGVPDAAREYVEFCQSQQGQNIVAEVGFVSQNLIAFNPSVPSTAPDSYLELADSAERLSVNFRFAEGSPKLDNKAYRDLARLVEFMKMPENKHSRLYLVGFSDAGTGAFQDELLSRYRALAVRGVLLRQNIMVAGSFGLGAFMPVADNAHAQNKLKNGRVEVWLLRDWKNLAAN